MKSFGENQAHDRKTPSTPAPRQRLAALAPEQSARLILFAALLLGGWLRFSPGALAGFPLNDGGMFAAAIESLLKNHLALPARLPYNGLEIPFVYPPLPFYAAALFQAALRVPVTSLLIWLPAALSTLCIPAVYRLLRALTPNPLVAAGAALLYAFLPAGMTWLVMGGGLTRSFGLLFLLLTTRSAYGLFQQNEKGSGWQTALWGSLTILSHPEMALHAAGLAATLLLFAPRRENFLRALGVGAAILTFTSPWWATALLRFGLEPFRQAAALGGHDWLWILQQLGLLELSGEKLTAALGLLGLGVLLARREFLPVALFCLPYLANPRNAGSVAIVFLAYAVSVACFDLIAPGLQNHAPHGRAALAGLAVYAALTLLLGATLETAQQSRIIITPQDRQALGWVSAHTPTDSRFLVLTGSSHPFYDPVPEWFPVLAERTSLGTLQGREWQFGEHFSIEMGQLLALQQCYYLTEPCLAERAAVYPPAGYVYVEKTCAGQAGCALPAGQQSPLIASLRQAGDSYKVVFENEGVVIFARR